ncbi:ABC transporter permease [Streptomyces xantholiticus]|uniref:ABC transporter permease n=1 Tax=Streptomyces xantholiticus TaxID=68285 RepID=A0ABV1UUP4_9ACTN
MLAVVGLLPWLSGRDPALSLLRARSAEQAPTPEALAAIRADLGLDAGPLGLLGQWAAGLFRGDLGVSWVSGTEVLPSVLAGLQVSLALMGAALVVALLTGTALVVPVLVRGRETSGAFAAMLTAVPEFLLSTVLLIVTGVWLGLLPTSGWAGPAHMVLPALALGVPAGGLLGRLVAEALPAVLDERWTQLWRGAGVGRTLIAAAALRRVLPPLTGQFGMVVVGLTGGAVAVELIFAIPGLSRTTLGAVKSQDLPRPAAPSRRAVRTPPTAAAPYRPYRATSTGARSPATSMSWRPYDPAASTARRPRPGRTVRGSHRRRRGVVLRGCRGDGGADRPVRLRQVLDGRRSSAAAPP